MNFGPNRARRVPTTGDYGVELSYVRHHESAPRVMRRYGFVASRPLPDGKALDGVFRYNYTRGSTLGPDGQQNDLSLGLIRYAAYGPVAPFVGADLGWAWARAGAARENSFFYQLRVGAEVMLSTAASMTPYISFQEARRFHDHAWQVGTRFAFRVSPDWSTTLALGMDDGHNVAWTFGAQPRF